MTPYYVALRAPHETCRRHPLPPNPIRTGVGARIRCSRESERGRPVSVSARTPSRARWPTSEPGPARGADRASTPLPAAMPPKSRRTSSRDRRCRPRRSAPSANDRRTMQRQAGLQNCTGYHAAPTNQAAIAVSAGRARRVLQNVPPCAQVVGEKGSGGGGGGVCGGGGGGGGLGLDSVDRIGRRVQTGCPCRHHSSNDRCLHTKARLPRGLVWIHDAPRPATDHTLREPTGETVRSSSGWK